MDMDHAAALVRLTRYYESLSLQNIGSLGEFYTPNAYFRNPFNEVRTSAEMAHIFRRLLMHIDVPRIEITATILQSNQAFLVWNFRCRLKRWHEDELTIRGASHLRLSNDGRVAYQRDYWDVAEELYEKLPMLGRLMRWLKRRMC
ncbi:isomerase [Pandoraea terrae]|uniref:Isomerase n=1 Tax=Pandoraea terrae TaxID=1537710 RepID=A0A5E4YEZ0_9BURK|nr:nuclear transport factor 2 family protein [Pandoraea terrae]VVE47027.1 isomerase [Pandoraea terrae]